MTAHFTLRMKGRSLMDFTVVVANYNSEVRFNVGPFEKNSNGSYSITLMDMEVIGGIMEGASVVVITDLGEISGDLELDNKW